jgi:hypothetical protein
MVASMGEEKYIPSFVRKETARLKWEDNIKMGIREKI